MSARGCFYESLYLVESAERELLDAYGAGNLYWTEWFCEPLQIDHMARLLAIHLSMERPHGQRMQYFEVCKADLVKELTAWAARENAASATRQSAVDPRRALKWLSELRKHLIPRSLAAWLGDDGPFSDFSTQAHLSSVISIEKPAIHVEGDDGHVLKTGPRPLKSKAVEAKMRRCLEKGEMTLADFRLLTKKELPVRFGAKDTTCFHARKAVLRTLTNSDQQRRKTICD